jgi:hypothetical protein
VTIVRGGSEVRDKRKWQERDRGFRSVRSSARELRVHTDKVSLGTALVLPYALLQEDKNLVPKRDVYNRTTSA